MKYDGKLAFRQIRYGRPVQGLAPGVLIKATDRIENSIFTGSIVLINKYHPNEGAMGFIINKQRVRARIGGPVSIDETFILHNIPRIPGAVEIIQGVNYGGHILRILQDRQLREGEKIAFIRGFSG